MNLPKKRIAIVVQRYGAEVIGGAELHARLVAEKLQSELGCEVTVLTTTALSFSTWDHHYPEGDSHVGGVMVRRFRPQHGRLPGFRVANRILAILAKMPFISDRWRVGTEELLARIQGPYVPELISYIKNHHKDFDQFFFFTYLYFPTVKGSEPLKHRFTLIPTAHDERAFYFLTTKRTLQNAKRIFANSDAEAELITRTHGIDINKIDIVGVGIDEPSVIVATSTTKDRYALYLGRIGRSKQVDQLIQWFTDHPSSLSLYLAGELEPGFQIPTSSRIKYLGKVNEATKSKLLTEADLVINPSAYESLSLLSLEAAVYQKPMILNINSPVMATYAKALPSAFGYLDQKEFNDRLDSVVQTNWQDEVAQTKLMESKAWVLDRYSWSRVLAHYSVIIG